MPRTLRFYDYHGNKISNQLKYGKRKESFKNFTIAEVNRAERDSYVVQIGNDFYSKDGDMVFTAAQAGKYYETLLDNIVYTLDSGNAKQRAAAMKCLEKLRVYSLRLQ